MLCMMLCFVIKTQVICCHAIHVTSSSTIAITVAVLLSAIAAVVSAK
jgi:hypothetical protein